MTDQQIKEHLLEKFRMFAAIMPEALANEVAADSYFAGGAIVNLVLGDAVVDYDLFFTNEKVAEKFREWAKLNQLPADVELRAITTNAVTFKFPDETVFQCVTRFTGPPARVFNDFDFTHTKCYYELVSGTLEYNSEVIRNKWLRYDGVKDKYTLNTLKRLVKFTNRGWQVDNQSLIELHKACAKNDLNDPEVMKDLAAGFYGSSFK